MLHVLPNNHLKYPRNMLILFVSSLYSRYKLISKSEIYFVWNSRQNNTVLQYVIQVLHIRKCVPPSDASMRGQQPSKIAIYPF
jgi:hypothetical protein